MVGVVLLVLIIMAVVADFGTGIGFLLACYLWSFLLYWIVWLFYAMLDKKQEADQTRFVLIGAVVVAGLVSPFEIGQHLATNSDTSSTAASTDPTSDTREREVQAIRADCECVVHLAITPAE
jgi:membrane protein implicated in regulation of membrane protease activity